MPKFYNNRKMDQVHKHCQPVRTDGMVQKMWPVPVDGMAQVSFTMQTFSYNQVLGHSNMKIADAQG